MIMKYRSILALSALWFGIMQASPVLPNTATDQDRAQEAAVRINVAGRQRMLTQRMAKALCFAMSGVDTERQSEIAFLAANEFQNALDALTTGSDALGLAPEPSVDIRDALEEVRRLSQPLTASVMQIVSGDRHSVAVRLVIERNEPTLEQMDATVDKIVRAAGTLSGDSATTVNLAGRQRMLTQRIAKDLCFAAIDVNRDASLPTLNKSVALFDTTLTQLINGDARAGLLPPGTPRIAAHLDTVKAKWDEILPALEALPSAPDLGDAEMLRFAEDLDAILDEMNMAVALWADHAK